MKRLSILLGLVVLVGCGGSGAGKTPDAHPYAGTYTGSWTRDVWDNGTCTFTIDEQYNLRGTITHTPKSLSGEISGNADDLGFVSGFCSYPPSRTDTFQMRLFLSSKSASGVGIMFVNGDAGHDVAFTLTKS